MNLTKNFCLTDEEFAQAEKWMEERRQRLGAIGGQFTFTFTLTSIGTVVKLEDAASGQTLDLTNYDAW